MMTCRRATYSHLPSYRIFRCLASGWQRFFARTSRFSRSQINAILEGGTTASEDEKPPIVPSDLPIHCIQVIQDVFAEVAGVGVVATHKNGEPLTNISNSCEFCDLILNSETVYRACVDTWKQLASLPPAKDITFFTCHAGMQYAEEPTPEQTRKRIDQIAQKHGISADELSEAASEIPILDERIQAERAIATRNAISGAVLVAAGIVMNRLMPPGSAYYPSIIFIIRHPGWRLPFWQGFSQEYCWCTPSLLIIFQCSRKPFVTMSVSPTSAGK